jgi:hypothetical protein
LCGSILRTTSRSYTSSLHLAEKKKCDPWELPSGSVTPSYRQKKNFSMTPKKGPY